MTIPFVKIKAQPFAACLIFPVLNELFIHEKRSVIPHKAYNYIMDVSIHEINGKF